MLDISKGEWKTNGYRIEIYDKECDRDLAIAIAYGDPKEEQLANATLIAEAGNISQECGLMPRELLKNRDELFRALERLLERVDKNGGLGEYKGGPAFAMKDARDLLNKRGN